MRDTGGMSEELPDDGTEEGSDGKGAGIAIGGLNVALYTLLPALLAVGIWTLISVYAIVKWIGSAPEKPDPVRHRPGRRAARDPARGLVRRRGQPRGAFAEPQEARRPLIGPVDSAFG